MGEIWIRALRLVVQNITGEKYGASKPNSGHGFSGPSRIGNNSAGFGLARGRRADTSERLFQR
jgi:hypothetical protein